MRKQEETVEAGMGRKKGNVKQNMSPLFLGSRELQRAEEVTGTKHLGCRLSCGSGTMGEGEPRWLENEIKSAFPAALMCLSKDYSSDLTFGHTIEWAIPKSPLCKRHSFFYFNISTNPLLSLPSKIPFSRKSPLMEPRKMILILFCILLSP